ncbi:hypothetical protein [Phenylobacterium sp.]|uniref:hypothetical protein n=1 Tax=Phenylobacterium sp. TaxID=1871053 RepID=UPI0025F1E304|nr:hypothetical protein [Phenylobacterium sp.]MBX3482198.1 hypothetical protein [Phenylobacterium sp.]MCW5758404.1 hypothetical protein [Phenylobacterium sp.]
MNPGWIAAAAVLVAGPAMAQGTFSPGQKPGSTFGGSASPSTPKPGSYLPSTPPAPAAKPRTTYGAPEAPTAKGFEPYKPFSGSSVYSSPSASAKPDPCKTSVYMNACDKKR